MKKIKLLALVPLLIAPMMTACQDDGVFTIGICQLAVHEALDQATEGFKQAVEEGLGKDNVKFDYQNAQGSPDTCVTIANSFVSKKVDLIMANATAALQAAVNSTQTIPILGTSITDYGTALDLDDFKDDIVGGNVSGTSDLAPLDEQAEMIQELFPNAKKVGLLYCSAEANSLFQINKIKQFLTGDGIETKTISFSDTNELSSILEGNINDLDVLYIPTDNTCADNASIIDAVCRSKELPIICGEENICRECGVASLSIDYFNIGKKTGEMAVEILKDGKDISKMPIAYDQTPVKKYNKEICEQLGIAIPNTYIEIE